MNEIEETNKIAIFEGVEIRKEFVNGEWQFSVIDIIKALTNSNDPTNYWSMLKKRELKHGVQLSTFCGQLKMLSGDGRQKFTDVANTESIFRIIQSIPSRKAEPFKQWLAKVGKERLDEIEQPAKAMERARNYYLTKGYSPEWVQNRTLGIETRGQFTDTLKESGIKEGKDYAILTNEIYQSTFDFNTQQYKEHKGLAPKESLRDNMTPLELVATMFSEASSTEIIKKTEAKGFEEDKAAIRKGGAITKEALKKIEEQTGEPVKSKKNNKKFNTSQKHKEIAQGESKKKGLSPFDKDLKGLVSVPPEKKE